MKELQIIRPSGVPIEQTRFPGSKPRIEIECRVVVGVT
jgi:hypothetical protein